MNIFATLSKDIFYGKRTNIRGHHPPGHHCGGEGGVAGSPTVGADQRIRPLPRAANRQPPTHK